MTFNGVKIPVQVDTGSSTLAIVGKAENSPVELPSPTKCYDSLPVTNGYFSGGWDAVTCRADIEMGGLKANGVLYAGITESKDMGCTRENLGIVGFGFRGMVIPGTTALQYLWQANPEVPLSFGIQACFSPDSSQGGSLTLGYSDPAHYSEELVPLKVTNGEEFWCVNMTSLQLKKDDTTWYIPIDTKTYYHCNTIIDSGNDQGLSFMKPMKERMFEIFQEIAPDLDCLPAWALSDFPNIEIGLETKTGDKYVVELTPIMYMSPLSGTCFTPSNGIGESLPTNNNLGQGLLENYYAYFSAQDESVSLAPIAGCGGPAKQSLGE